MQSLRHIILILTLLFFCSCHQEQTIPVVINVSLHIKDENHTSPMYVTINNETKSASSYLWTFEGGEPATSDKKDPSPVRFTTPGNHKITLEAWNDGNSAAKTFTIWVDSAMVANVETLVEINNYAPAVFQIKNLSYGGSSYQWTFEGGQPSVYTGQHPPTVKYSQEGVYTIILTITNGSSSIATSREIIVKEPIDASFSIIPSFEDIEDYEAPLRATFNTHLQGVESLRWECAGATITKPDSKDASIHFPESGKYTVYLTVSNGKNTKKISQEIIVKPNTNLRTHSDIQLGINTAQNTIGSYYSTILRRSFTSSEITTMNGSMVDIVYLGLNNNFTYNQFVSPDALSDTPLKDISGARPTVFINNQSMSGSQISPLQFTSMATDNLLKSITVNQVNVATDYFNQSPLPCVVLFRTSDGRKGAILVKEIVKKGKDNSYIIADIKVQKND